MSELTFTSLLPDSADSERQLLARSLGGITSSTLMASAARTATTITAALSSRGFSGALIHWNVTAASGTGGLTLRLVAVDPISAVQTVVGSLPAVTTVGSRIFQIAPGVGGAAVASVFSNAGLIGARLPTTFQVQVLHADASSYTYAANIEFLP